MKIRKVIYDTEKNWKKLKTEDQNRTCIEHASEETLHSQQPLPLVHLFILRQIRNGELKTRKKQNEIYIDSASYSRVFNTKTVVVLRKHDLILKYFACPKHDSENFAVNKLEVAK